jgi:hypothetical protein
MHVRPRTVLTGMLSHVPGVMSAYRRIAFRPNLAAADGSYRIWMKHYSVARVQGMPAVPETVVELGPGMPLGAGLAALLCGAQRRVIYTTNAIESIHSQPRKIIKSRGHFPSDEAATKLLWLALRNITADWGRAAKEWREAMNQFAIAYGDRFTRTVA